MGRWVALDLETTGLSPTRHEIREIAALPFDAQTDGMEEPPWSVVAHLQPSPGQNARATLVQLLGRIGEGSAIVSHNAAFDLAFLAEALRRARVRSFGLRAYCTLRLSRAVFPDLCRYDLASLRDVLQLPKEKPHVALADARTVAALFKVVARKAGILDEESLRTLHGPPLQVRSRSAVPGAPP